ncbi:PAS domain-containing protein [Metabacillus arenae]|uniref:histidine kinase n=1 Tax=Metabacillus arenae TaxID=2771434 RepID=A0A926RYT6_9BACI|nr:PAS domain-containing protein [Metabacillus arenae]MBD1383313.1 PAS domain-containing protein [Metabacillus arenae]
MKQDLETSKQLVEKIDLYAVITASGRFSYISSNSKEFLGYEPSFIVGSYIKDYVHKEDLFLVESYFYNEHHLYPCNFRFQKRDQSYIWIEIYVDFIKSTVVQQDREMILKIIVCPPETQLIHKGEEVYTLDKENHLSCVNDAAHLLEELPSPMFISKEGKILFVNKSMVLLLGVKSNEDLIGRMTYEFIAEEFHDIVKNRISRMQQGGFVGLIEQTWIRVDGTPLHLEVKATPTIFQGEYAEMVLLIDISSRKKFQKILQKSRERYQRLIQNSLDTIAVIHCEKWVFINESGVKLFQANDYPDMLGKNIYQYLHPDDHQHTKEMMANIIHGKTENEVRTQSWFTFHEKTIYTEMVCIPTTYFGEPAVQVILRDISDRKRAEELMIRSEKLSVAGQLAAGIAHEIRNPLTAIKGFLQLMQPDQKKKKQYFDIVFSELSRIELILSELLLLAKPQQTVAQSIDMKVLLHDVSTLLETQANLNNVVIEQEFAGSELWLDCDPNQMKQVFINLIKNAIDSMKSGGTVKIVCRKQRDCLLIQVADEGEGISKEILKKIGEPFFTTKEKGTGLGLMITFKIIENHKGTVKIDTEKGKGTTFTICFPTT